MKFSPGRISLVSLVLLLVWLALAYGVRRQYLNVLRKAIERRTLDPERTAPGVAGLLDSTTSEVVAMSLEHTGEQQVLYGLSLFEMGSSPASHSSLRKLLQHPSPAVRQKALEVLADAGDTSVLSQAEELLRDEAPEVRTEALHYLVEIAGRDPLDLLRAESDFADYSIPGTVVSYLACTGRAENVATARMILQGMLARSADDAPRARAEAARALGVIPPPCELHSELARLLCDESVDVQRQALLSAGKIRDPLLLPTVIAKLGDRRLELTARVVLPEYGDQAVSALQNSLNDDAVPMTVRKQIPNVLAGICTPQAATALATSLIQGDPGLRYDLLKALNKVKRREPTCLPNDVDFADLLRLEAIG